METQKRCASIENDIIVVMKAYLLFLKNSVAKSTIEIVLCQKNGTNIYRSVFACVINFIAHLNPENGIKYIAGYGLPWVRPAYFSWPCAPKNDAAYAQTVHLKNIERYMICDRNG